MSSVIEGMSMELWCADGVMREQIARKCVPVHVGKLQVGCICMCTTAVDVSY